MLLMIPGPIELSPAVHAACAMAPLSHVDPALRDGTVPTEAELLQLLSEKADQLIPE